jgi:hypothetical protein
MYLKRRFGFYILFLWCFGWCYGAAGLLHALVFAACYMSCRCLVGFSALKAFTFVDVK